MSNGFIRYETKKDAEYACVCRAMRTEGKKTNTVEWLGKVIDKENGIYQSRKRGKFQYSLENGEIKYIPSAMEKLILDFGDSYFLKEMLNRSGFMKLIENAFGEKTDALTSLLFYKSLGGEANCYAQTWWEGSYARLLFPKVSLASQRISEALQEFGDEGLQRIFFKEYLQYVSSQCSVGVLIDSTGLPNDIHFPLTALIGVSCM